MFILNVVIVIICSIIIIFMFWFVLFCVLSGCCFVVVYLGCGMLFEVMYLYVVSGCRDRISFYNMLYFVRVCKCVAVFFSFLFSFCLSSVISFSFSFLEFINGQCMWVEMDVLWGNCSVLSKTYERGK